MRYVKFDKEFYEKSLVMKTTVLQLAITSQIRCKTQKQIYLLEQVNMVDIGGRVTGLSFDLISGFNGGWPIGEKNM